MPYSICAALTAETFSDIPQYYAQNIYCYDFEDAMQVAGYAQKKVSYAAVYPTFAGKASYISELFCRTDISFALDKVLKSKMMIKLDSLLKGNG